MPFAKKVKDAILKLETFKREINNKLSTVDNQR